MTTRELFNRWFRNHKKVPVFNEDVDVVCKANQIMTEDGESVEDKLKESSGGGCGCNLTMRLYGTPIYNVGYDAWNAVDSEENTPNGSVIQSDIDAIVAAPDGTIVSIILDNAPSSIGIKSSLRGGTTIIYAIDVASDGIGEGSLSSMIVTSNQVILPRDGGNPK